MRGVFDDEELEPVKPRRDTELTLGSSALVAMFFGLLLLCGLCFGAGYAIGHRGSQPAAAAASMDTASLPIQPAGSIAKPSATEQVVQTPQADSTGSDQAASQTSPQAASQLSSSGSGLTQTAGAQTQPAAEAAPPNQPQVHPALAAGVAVQPGPSGQPAPTASLHPALAPAVEPVAAAGSLMVQIAAVSNSEDAAVLTGALRKRGYAVNVRREPADNLIHVRIGPFATPAEANSWRMKLLNDGYNAVIQP